MDVKNAFVETAMGVLSEFGFSSVFAEKNETGGLVEAEYVNVVMELTGNKRQSDYDGKERICFGYSVSYAGGMEFTEVDDMVKSAIGELLNIIAGNAFSKVDVKAAVYISTPTLLIGEEFLFCFKALAQTNWF